MSWSGNTTIPKGGDYRQAVDEISIAGNDDCPEERDRAAAAAKEAAITLLESGVLGPANDYTWQVNLSGHATPGNQPKPGSTPDCLTVTVGQAWKP